MATTGTVWAFDLGKGSIGDYPSPRWGEGGRSPDEVSTKPHPKFLHKASLLILAEFTKDKTGGGNPRRFCLRNAFEQVYPHGG